MPGRFSGWLKNDAIMKQLEETTRVEPSQKGISENEQVSVSRMDAAILNSMRDLHPCCKDGVEKLGVVMEELVNMLDLDGTGIDVYLLQYVVDARQTLRAILQVLDDSSKEKVSIDGKN